VRNKRCSLGLL